MHQRIEELRDKLMQINHVDTEALRDCLLEVVEILADLQNQIGKNALRSMF